MKKLMVLLACGLGLTVANAATVQWISGAAMKGVDSGTYLDAGKIKMYVFELASQTALDAFKTDAASISSLDLSTATLSGATSKSTAGITLSDPATEEGTPTYGAGDKIYSAVVITQDDGGKMYYVAQKVAGEVDSLDGGVAFGSLAKKVYNGGGADVTWTAMSVPEPTSAMLLVLGLAGLALRRRRA